MNRITRRSLFGRIIRIPAAIIIGITATTAIPTKKIAKDPPLSVLPVMWSIDSNHPLARGLVGYAIGPYLCWTRVDSPAGRKVYV